MKATKDILCSNQKWQLNAMLGRSAAKKLKQALYTLSFLVIFTAAVVSASMHFNFIDARNTGAFDQGAMLYALCYDCSEEGMMKTLFNDIMLIRRIGLKLVLPSEAGTIESDSVLIVLENVSDEIFDLNAAFDHGLSAAVILYPTASSDDADVIGGLAANGISEAVITIPMNDANSDSNLFSRILLSKFEIKERLGIEPKSFLLPCATTAEQINSFYATDALLYEGRGINRIEPHQIDPCILEMARRDQRMPLSALFDAHIMN